MSATWGIADQAVSSGTNFVAGIILARSLGPEGYGSFVVTFTVWVFVMSINRALLIQPFVIRVSSKRSAWEHEPAGELAGLVLVVGLFLGGLILAGSIVVGALSHVGSSLLILGGGCGVLLLQDFWRYLAFARSIPYQAFLNDAVWALVQFTLLGVLAGLDRLTPTTAVLTWVAGGVAGGICGVAQLGVTPTIGRELWSMARDVLRLGRWLLFAELAFAAGANGVILLLAASQGSQSAGAYRAVVLLFAPLTVVTSGIAAVALPRVATYALDDRRRLISKAKRYSTATGTVAVLYGLGSWAGADRIVTDLFGRSFSDYSNLVAPLAIAAAFAATAIGAEMALKATQHGRALTIVHSSSALVKLGLAGTGLHLAQTRGLAWGVSVGAAFHSLLTWFAVHQVGKHERSSDKS